MGVEEGTLVPGGVIDLPPYKDLIDLRLPRAFRVWTAFKERHETEIDNIQALTPERVAELSNELANSVGRVIGDRNVKASPVSVGKINQLRSVVELQGEKRIFMRHGEQNPPDWISSIEDPAIRKIRMMQNPFNRLDCLTNRGFVDVFVTALSLLYIQKISGRNLRILSSYNRRAEEVAEIFSMVISDAPFSIEDELESITYRNEHDDPSASLDQILEDLPLGTMPWIPELVDKWSKETSKGERPSEMIIRGVSKLLNGDAEEDDLILVLTHSQQLAEVLQRKGALTNPHVRFPELTMMVVDGFSKPTIFAGGVLEEREQKINMRKILERLGGSHEWYRVRRKEYESDNRIPFLVSHEPFYISDEEAEEIRRIGIDISEFMVAANQLYHSDEAAKTLLDRGKPSVFQDKDPRYLFVRPDILLTKDGMTVCEVETSPFGLALADLLNGAYSRAGFNTLVGDGILRQYLIDNTPAEGVIVYSRNTSSYVGQLEYLAKEISFGAGRSWRVEEAGFVREDITNVYRAFYPYEIFTDLFVNHTVNKLLGPETVAIPSFTPHMEEKALLALIWDSRWEKFFTDRLGLPTLNHLRNVIPQTWIVGEEEFFGPGLPESIRKSRDLASLPASRRKYVLKKSGFSSGSSWSEGVIFLHERSRDNMASRLVEAEKDASCLYVIQKFRDYDQRPMTYEGYDGNLGSMSARIRVTPYFSMLGETPGQLIAIKATGCENTNYVHASTASVNAAVAQT